MWCARWVERSLRKIRGEGASKPSSILDTSRRANDFIERLKGARPKPKAKAKAEAKAQVEKLQIEPVFGSFDEAQEAAFKCTKCLPTKSGTKGCRACMGEHFEDIRQRGEAPTR